MDLEKIKKTWNMIKPILLVICKTIPGTIDDAFVEFIDRVIKEL